MLAPEILFKSGIKLTVVNAKVNQLTSRISEFRVFPFLSDEELLSETWENFAVISLSSFYIIFRYISPISEWTTI